MKESSDDDSVFRRCRDKGYAASCAINLPLFSIKINARRGPHRVFVFSLRNLTITVITKPTKHHQAKQCYFVASPCFLFCFETEMKIANNCAMCVCPATIAAVMMVLVLRRKGVVRSGLPIHLDSQFLQIYTSRLCDFFFLSLSRPGFFVHHVCDVWCCGAVLPMHGAPSHSATNATTSYIYICMVYAMCHVHSYIKMLACFCVLYTSKLDVLSNGRLLKKSVSFSFILCVATTTTTYTDSTGIIIVYSVRHNA